LNLLLINGGRILNLIRGYNKFVSIGVVEVNFFGFYRNLLYLTEGNTGFGGLLLHLYGDIAVDFTGKLIIIV
jgi:hypothetical protein